MQAQPVGRDAAHSRGRGNDVELVRQLFRLGCLNVNSLDSSGNTALFWVSNRDHEAIVRELLAHGADVSIMDEFGWTPLMLASSEGHLTVMRLLCDAPVIDLTSRSGGQGQTRSAGPNTSTTPTSRPSCARAACPSERCVVVGFVLLSPVGRHAAMPEASFAQPKPRSRIAKRRAPVFACR